MLRPRFIGLLLALVTLLAYLPAESYLPAKLYPRVARYLPVTHSFLVYDDDEYVTDNHMVQKGLTWAGIQWAFTTTRASNWHPLTWLSHMTDCTLFGLNANLHYSVNVLFHAANAVLLFGLLLRVTGAVRPAAFVAALFAWHPLHVESVAWISERKDVLSTFFALLTLLAYERYTQSVTGDACRVTGDQPGGASSPVLRHPSRYYALALVFFALGLMAKPMVVTLPLVMLLLDYWPLRRVSCFPGLVREKWPFFLLTAVSCVITFLAQRSGEAVVSLEKVPLGFRLENAPMAYGRYLLKTIWPVNLAVIYPLSPDISWLAVIAVSSVLIVFSAAVWRARKRSPGLLVGWLWFVGTLVPVIGLVQVGGAALADRYAYFPLVGVFMAVAYGVRDWADRLPFPKTVVITAAVLVPAGCLVLTENQLRYWRDSESLFRHALAVTKDNDIAHVNLGLALEKQGKLNEALAEYREAERLLPGRYQVHNNLGYVLDRLGQPEEALTECREAVRLNPQLPALHEALGIVLVELGRFDEARNEFAEAARLDPTYPWPHFQMGKALLKQGRDTEAIDQLREALRLDPDNFQILAYVAHVLAAAENPEIRNGKYALVLAVKAKTLTDRTPPQTLDALLHVLDALGMACAETGDFTNAQEVTQRALDLATAAKMKNLDSLRQRLELYKKHQPWRESFTNPPAKPLPQN
jgi:tetratricopeptide (TPR) repeat protein